MLNKHYVSSWDHASQGMLSAGKNLCSGLHCTCKSSTCPDCSLFWNVLLWPSSQARNSLGCLFSICPYAFPQPQKSLWMRLLLRNYNRNLAANAWSQRTGPKGKQILHLVQLSGVLEKHNPGDCFIMPLSYVRENCTSERALSELPHQKTTQVSSSIWLVLGQKDRSHHEEKTGCLKPFTEHSGDVTRVGPIYHIATKNSCPQTISTSSRLQAGVGKPFSEEI